MLKKQKFLGGFNRYRLVITLGLAVLLRLAGRAHPCAWMDHTVAPGAWQALRGFGGMRCEPLTDGVLRIGPVAVDWLD